MLGDIKGVGDYLVDHAKILEEDEEGAEVKRRENNLINIYWFTCRRRFST